MVIKMDDLISRQAAIDAIKALWNDAPSAQHVSAMFDCEDAIRALPSAQPEYGRWLPVKLLDDEADFGEVDGVQCSVCGDTFDNEYWAKTYFKYCPYCGTSMDEVTG